MEYVSLAKSRAGYQPSDTPKKRTKPSAPETSATPAANTNQPGGESASKTEEG